MRVSISLFQRRDVLDSSIRQQSQASRARWKKPPAEGEANQIGQLGGVSRTLQAVLEGEVLKGGAGRIDQKAQPRRPAVADCAAEGAEQGFAGATVSSLDGSIPYQFRGEEEHFSDF